MYDIKVRGIRGAQAATRQFPRRMDTAARQAVRRTQTFAVKISAQEINRDYNIKVGEAKKVLKKSPVYKVPRGEVSASGKSIPLRRFSPKDTRKAAYDPKGKGVTFRVRRNGPRKTLKHAFIAKGKNSNVPIVFARQIGPGGKPVKRLEIDQQMTLSAPKMFDLQLPGVQPRTQKRLRVLLDQNINFQLLRWSGKA